MIRRRHDYTDVVEAVRGADGDESFSGREQQIFRPTDGQPPEALEPGLDAYDGATREEAITRTSAAADAWIDRHRRRSERMRS